MFPPWLVLIPGLLLIFAGNARDRFGVMFCGALWLFYGMYEHNVQATCTGECNIRVDLLLIYPVLAIGTIGSFVSLMREDKPKRRPRRR
jgi:hypothetical protein